MEAAAMEAAAMEAAAMEAAAMEAAAMEAAVAIDPGGCGHWYWRHIRIGLHASLIHIGDREQCTDDAQ